MARILIIEKDETVRQLLEHQVKHLGHEPVVASPGLEVFGIVFDAALVEPKTVGALELVQAFRMTRPAMPLVCVSIASPTPEWKALAPDAYLVKPFPLRRLREVLDAALGTRGGADSCLDGALEIREQEGLHEVPDRVESLRPGRLIVRC